MTEEELKAIEADIGRGQTDFDALVHTTLAARRLVEEVRRLQAREMELDAAAAAMREALESLLRVQLPRIAGAAERPSVFACRLCHGLTGHASDCPGGLALAPDAGRALLDELGNLRARVAERAPRSDDREALGRLVRLVWIEWAVEQPNAKPSHLAPWEEMPESDREVDRRIGEQVVWPTEEARRAAVEQRDAARAESESLRAEVARLGAELRAARFSASGQAGDRPAKHVVRENHRLRKALEAARDAIQGDMSPQATKALAILEGAKP